MATPETRVNTQTEAVQLLRQAIQASGLSSSQYARTVLIRDGRTLRRWLAGTSPIPKSVIDFLTRDGTLEDDKSHL